MTPRVLHLLDLGAGEEPALACRAARAIPGFAHDVWSIGGSADDARFAAAAGLDARDRIAPPLGAPELAWRGARALARDRRSAGRPPDIIQCWSPRALVLARLALGPRIPTVTLATRNPAARGSAPFTERHSARFLKHSGPTGPITLVLRRPHWEAWLSAGASDVRLAPPPVPAQAQLRPAGDRRELRELLGIEPAFDAQTVAVVLLADPPGSGDARRFSFIMGLMHTVGRHVVGVVPQGCGATRSAARFVRAHGRRWGLIESRLPLTALSAAADVAVWTSPHAGLTLAAHYAAAGTPLVVSTPIAADELTAAIGRSASITAARGPELRALAAAVLPLVDAAAAHPHNSPRHPPMNAPTGASAAGPNFEAVLADIWRDAANLAAPAGPPRAAPQPAGAAP